MMSSRSATPPKHQEVNLSRFGSVEKYERCCRFMIFKSKVVKANGHGELEPFFTVRAARFNVEMGGVFSLILRLVFNGAPVSLASVAYDTSVASVRSNSFICK